MPELAEDTGLTNDEVVEVLGTDEALRRRRRNTWTVGIDDAAVLAELKRVAQLPGGNPLSAPFYDGHRKPGAIGSVRAMQRFQTWSAACTAAGVQHRVTTRDYNRQWTEEDLLEWVRRYVAEAEATASYRKFSGWLGEHREEGAPSAQTVRNYLGKWVDVVRAATAFSDIGAAAEKGPGSILGLPDSRWDLDETDSEVLTIGLGPNPVLGMLIVSAMGGRR